MIEGVAVLLSESILRCMRKLRYASSKIVCKIHYKGGVLECDKRKNTRNGTERKVME